MKPKKLEKLMYALMKEARRESFVDFLEYWDITDAEFEEIEQYFKKELDIKL